MEPKTEEQKAQETLEFILKIIRAPNLQRADQIQSVAQQLKKIEHNRYFTDVYTGLDPDAMNSEIRRLTNEQRNLLRISMDLYRAML